MNFAKWGWAASLLLLPLLMVHSLIDAVIIPRTAILLATLFCIISSFVLQAKEPFQKHIQTFLFSAFGLSFGLYLLAGLLSITNALSWSDGMMEWLKSFSWLGIILVGAFLLKDKTTELLFLKATVLATLVVSLIGIGEFLSIIHRLEEDKILYVVNSTLEHKNLLATALLLSLAFSLLLYQLATDKIWKGIAMTTIISALSLILVTQSRAAWGAMVGAFLLYVGVILLTASKRKKIAQPVYLVPILMLLVLGGLAAIWSYKYSIRNAPMARIQAIFTFEDTKNEHTETINERLALWSNTIEMIKDHPSTGVGLGNWKIHFPKYKMSGLRSELGEVFFQRPHNDYLWVTSETGIIGGLAYLTLLLSVLFYGFKLLKQKEVQESEDYDKILLLTSVFFAFMLFSAVDFPKERPVHLLWSGLIMAYLASYYHQYKEVPTETKNSLIAKVVPYLFLIITGAGLFFVGQRWKAEIHCKTALEARSIKQYNLVLEELELADNWAYRLDPAATPLSWYKGEAYYLLGDLPKALEAFQASNQLHPYHIHTLNNLGAVNFGLKNFEAAKNYFKQVLGFAPHFPDANMNMGAMAFNEGKIKEAVFYIGNCIPMSYKETRFLTFLNAICKGYANELKKIKELEIIYPIIDDFGNNQKDWQITIHQQAQQYHRKLEEQIYLDLLFIARDRQIINEAQADLLTPLFNNLLTKVQKL